MKTRLYFEAPSDLSVGTVRIKGEGKTIVYWVATPDNRTHRQDDLRPGIYSAEISPAGVSPQSVIFEVREGRDNSVILPSFSALSSSGSNTSFFDTDSQQAVAELPYSMKMNALEEPDLPPHQSEDLAGIIAAENIRDSKRLQQINISEERRRISIGLSEKKGYRRTFDPFLGPSRMELLSGRLEIEIPTDLSRDYWAGYRVRLSAAIEQVRIERCLLPLYRGGTRITVGVPSFAPSDLELGIMPIDPKLRALVRALDAGTSAEAAAVRDHVLGKDDPTVLLGDQSDPWAAILAGLLAIRFPEIFQPIDPEWADKLVKRAGWAFDVHVIRASQALSAANSTSDAKGKAVSSAIAFLAKAQDAGYPYYRYTNQLFADMAFGIADYLKTKKPAIDPDAVRRFDQLYGRWYRELPLQRGAGWAFTWLERDQAALNAHEVLVPLRNSSGKLRSRDTSIIFEGLVSAGQITIMRGGPNSLALFPSESSIHSSTGERLEDALEYGFSQMPALGRAMGPDDDPNKGRFGGEASREGFHLTATFEPMKSHDWVTIILTVEADRSVKIGLGEFAWFILHPTFSPSALKVSFRGNRARLSIQAWGGFTVGVWLPKTGLELECDLAQLKDAPKIIKTR